MTTTTNQHDASSFDIKSLPSLAGKSIFVTGGTAGLGEQSIIYLARAGPKVIYFTGRNKKAAQALIDRVKTESPEVTLTFVEMDMSSLSSISAAVKPFVTTGNTQKMERLDIVIASAGVMASPAITPYTKDGFESHFGINHLGNALVLRLLLPVLQLTAALPGADVRIVIVTSTGWRMQAKSDNPIDYNNLQKAEEEQGCDKRVGNFTNLVRDLRNYAQSKLANIAYAKAIQSRYGDQGITGVAVHPGVVTTSLVGSLGWSWALLVKATNFNSMVAPEEGVKNQLWAATGDGVVGGKWYLPVGQMGEEEGTVLVQDGLGDRLWTWTDEVFEQENLL